MDAAQRLQFREKGYIVLRGAVAPEHIVGLNKLYDAKVKQEVLPAAEKFEAETGLPFVWHGFHKHKDSRSGGQILWGKPYYDLVDLPAVSPILAELLGDPAFEHATHSAPPHLAGRFRLDHDNIHFSPRMTPIASAHSTLAEPTSTRNIGARTALCAAVCMVGSRGFPPRPLTSMVVTPPA